MKRNMVFERSSTSCVHIYQGELIKLNICDKATTLILINNVMYYIYALHESLSSKVGWCVTFISCNNSL